MANSDFIDQCLQDAGDAGIALPQSRYADKADVVLSGQDVDAHLAERLLQRPSIAGADFITAARCINLRFADEALYSAVQKWRNEVEKHCCSATPDNSAAAHWDNPYYAVQYAHYRAGCVARDKLHWDYGLEPARRLAVAIVLFPLEMRVCGEPEAFLQRLADFARVYAEWHETLLIHRAAKFRITNGELMQKEAIQYPMSSALLARAAAITLQNGLRMLKIEPTKEWVE